MIAKFKAKTPMHMEFEIDDSSLPLVIKFSGWELPLVSLQELNKALTAALEFAEKVQFDIDYDADVVVKATDKQVKDDEDLPF